MTHRRACETQVPDSVVEVQELQLDQSLAYPSALGWFLCQARVAQYQPRYHYRAIQLGYSISVHSTLLASSSASSQPSTPASPIWTPVPCFNIPDGSYCTTTDDALLHDSQLALQIPIFWSWVPSAPAQKGFLTAA